MTEVRDARSYGTILVVGGCGFLGSRVVDQLLNFPSEQQQPNAVASSEPASSANGAVSSKAANGAALDPTSPVFPFPSLGSRYPRTSSSTKVHALDLRCTQHIFPGCTYHEGDITSAEKLLEVFRKVKPDVVINTASPSWEAPADILRKVNIDGTRTLLEVAGGKHGDWSGGKGGCKVFVHTSSASVVHDGDSDLINADERYPLVCPNPREYYSETKVHAERLALAANDTEEYGHMLTCAVRPAGIVGEGDRAGFSGGILNTAKGAPSWQLHIQLGEGFNLFDNTYVHNVVHGLLCAATALLQTHQRRQKGGAMALDYERVDGEAFNLTNDSPAYFWDATRFLYTGYGRDIRMEKVWTIPTGLASFVGGAAELFNYLSGRKGKLNRQTVKYTVIHRYYSCEKLKARTGYIPLVPIDEGLARAVWEFKEGERMEREKKGQ
ncbi:hypothetical protein PV08_01519 [Exophiala spinifera]|uniref:3-beta hydroxysteroid dehydrogenase/isomerase domain-containing protein n=1 Tax=Exophiala spinifera TaxID=91928 RepID=A0A0D2BR79_9EURO|nr:uncharacterized protein PV08_01519 [Exophiala spinifera]KIW20940.1 hypothetical protein PV08_01519 [Exophiala spinifera]